LRKNPVIAECYFAILKYVPIVTNEALDILRLLSIYLLSQLIKTFTGK